MKTLYLFRHAKSSWDDPALDDFDRPLNKRGLKAAPVMGKFMKRRQVEPDTILCSPAQRTSETARLAFKAGNLSKPVVLREDLYLAGAAEIMDILRKLDDGISSVMVVAHNPGLEDLLEALTGCEELVPTAALARIVLDIDKWRELGEDCGKLEWLVRPKDLTGE